MRGRILDPARTYQMESKRLGCINKQLVREVEWPKREVNNLEQ